MLNIKQKRISGLTLVELMIALAINSMLLVGLLAIFSANTGHYNKAINNNRLNQELQTALDIMSADIRRAGYWANALNDVDTGQNNNPFMVNSTDITVNGNNNCILFTYDHNSNGSLSAITSSSDDEHYGFRLNGQTLQARPPGASYDCSAAASSWENITNPNIIEITALTFTLSTRTITTGPSTRGIILRSVDISITGRLLSDTSVTKTLTQHVRIRNDKFVP